MSVSTATQSEPQASSDGGLYERTEELSIHGIDSARVDVVIDEVATTMKEMFGVTMLRLHRTEGDTIRIGAHGQDALFVNSAFDHLDGQLDLYRS